MKVLLVSPGQTDWADQHRLKGNLDIPLNADGVESIQKLAAKLLATTVTAIYCPTTLDGKQTAHIIGRITKAKVHARKALNDVDEGLWQGLTREELKRRHPQVYARWMNSPDSVRPPRGEDLTMVMGRVRTLAAELKRKRAEQTVLCVVPSLIRKVLARELAGTQSDPAGHDDGHDDDMDVLNL